MELPRWIIFLTVTSTAVFLMHYYLWMRLGRDPLWMNGGRKIWAVVLITLGLSIPLARVIYRFLPDSMGSIFASIALTWLGISFFWAANLLAFDLLKVGLALYTKFFSETTELAAQSRREFLARGTFWASTVVTVAATPVGIANAINVPEVKRVEVPLRRWPKKLDGYRIVQISDLHVGPTIKREFVQEVVEKTNALKPDMIALTGDFVDGTLTELRPHVEPLRALSAREGVVFVTGNHDYYSGVKDWTEYYRSMNFLVLENEIKLMGTGDTQWQLAGVDWQADFDKTFLSKKPDMPLITLMHQPKGVEHVIDKHGSDLQLSGHTHGGQIWPFSFLVGLVQPYVSGLHARGNGHVYVSNGTGFWGSAIRIGASAEITEIILRSPEV